MSDYSKKCMIFLTVCFVRKIKDLYTKNYTLTYDSCQETFVRKSIPFLYCAKNAQRYEDFGILNGATDFIGAGDSTAQIKK